MPPPLVTLLSVRCLQVQKVRYVWVRTEKRFQKIGVLEDKYTCSDVHSLLGRGFTNEEHRIRKKVVGPNRIEVEITPIWKLLLKEILNPYYWFQAGSIILWVAFGYYEFSFAILGITIISIIITIYELRRQSVNLHGMVEAHNSVTLTVCRSGDCKEIESQDLVPGDVFLLPQKKLYFPCDAILISGSCVVNEGMLTGESVPVTKTPLPNTNTPFPRKVYNIEDYKKNILFCGTELIQTRSTDVEPAKAVVLQTGFNTAKGDLVRSILYAKPVDAKLHRDALRFIMCLLFVAAIGFIYSVVVNIQNGSLVGETVILAIFLITIVVPPSLPAALAVGVLYAQKRLKKSGIFCISSQKINLCGWLNLFCFDKTGTLTEEGLDLWGIIPSRGQSFQSVHGFGSGDALPWGPLLGALAGCHSLIYLDGRVRGDPIDLKMFEGTRWAIEDSGTDDVSSGLIIKPGPEAGKVSVEGIVVVRQFPFSSSLKRMSVISRVIGTEKFMAFMKGAPETIISYCRPETVPSNFSRELDLYTKRGFRVIGLAYKALPTGLDFAAESFTRDEAESDLDFLGLLVMENRVKPETRPALQELLDAQIRVIMITGDNLQTALTVAKTSGMVPEGSRGILVEATAPEGSTPAAIILRTQEDDLNDKHIRNEHLINGEGPTCNCPVDEYFFAMSGTSYQVVVQHFYGMLPKLLMKGVVFARMSPGQKSSLIEEFQKLDYFVGMCGDGANDCGALKMAHAGISLSEHEASVVSPFTSKTPSIECVPQLIKEGRCTLASSFCISKYIIGTCITAFLSALLLLWKKTFLAEYQYLIHDMAIFIPTYLTITLTTAYPQLAPYRHVKKLISLPLLVSIGVNGVCVLVTLACAFVFVQYQPWYGPTDVFSSCSSSNQSLLSNEIHNSSLREEITSETYESTSLWFATSLCFISTSFVVSKGKPFRKPMYTNYLLCLALCAQTAMMLFLMFTNNESIQIRLQIVCTPLTWRVSLLIMGLVFLITTYFLEEYISDNRRFWIALKRCIKYKSKSKYRILQRLLAKDPHWPPLDVAIHAEQMGAELESNVGLLEMRV
ncbi:putative cation-transporting ATPase 13A4 [Lissotriton helveticus]